VVLWPLFMFALLVLNIELYFKRKSSRNEWFVWGDLCVLYWFHHLFSQYFRCQLWRQ
jgi:hypothetical protein